MISEKLYFFFLWSEEMISHIKFPSHFYGEYFCLNKMRNVLSNNEHLY